MPSRTETLRAERVNAEDFVKAAKKTGQKKSDAEKNWCRAVQLVTGERQQPKFGDVKLRTLPRGDLFDKVTKIGLAKPKGMKDEVWTSLKTAVRLQTNGLS